jgi:hypothetical protein
MRIEVKTDLWLGHLAPPRAEQPSVDARIKPQIGQEDTYKPLI